MKKTKGNVISITSGNGGVGKTVFATNLCGVYASLKKKVLLIDLDLTSGGVSVLLNLQKAKTIYNLADDIFNNRFDNSREYVYQYDEYIGVIPSCKDPRQGSKIDSKLIEQIVNIYKNSYDVIIIDTSHVPTSSTLASLDIASTILFMITDNPVSLKNASNMLEILKNVGKDAKVILNLSYRNEKAYFSKFDIKSIIGHNIDYILPQSMYITNINKYIMEGKILVLNNKLSFKNNSDRDLLIKIANKLIEGEQDEK